MADWRDWTGPESPWIREGHYVSYYRETICYYEYVIGRDFAHYEYVWPVIIHPGEESGHYVPDDLVPTQGYDGDSNMNQLWQMIFGILGQVYVYIEHPTDTHRHGVPKVPKPKAELREVSHYEEWMSPFLEPSFITEHILMRPGFDRIGISAYNPEAIDMTEVRLNCMIAKLLTERVGTEEYGELNPPKIKNNDSKTERLKIKWGETLEKLYKHQIPCRPLTLMPVRAPEAEV